jgi:hypothetical protein
MVVSTVGMNDFQLSEETVDDEAAVHDNAINAN